jgi:hypothetical protein
MCQPNFKEGEVQQFGKKQNMTIQAALPLKDENVFTAIFTQYQKSTTSTIILKFTILHKFDENYQCNNIKSLCAKLLTLMAVITEGAGFSSQVLMI